MSTGETQRKRPIGASVRHQAPLLKCPQYGIEAGARIGIGLGREMSLGSNSNVELSGLRRHFGKAPLERRVMHIAPQRNGLTVGQSLARNAAACAPLSIAVANSVSLSKATKSSKK